MTTEQSFAQPVALLVAGLADNKYFLGRRYAEWCTAAPALEDAVAAANMAQDEIGHARSLYPLLQDLVGSNPESEPETRSHFTNVPFLSDSFDGWIDFVAAEFLFDTAISTVLMSARSSSSSALAQRARRILEEERLHWLHAAGWTLRLASEAQRSERLRSALLASFSRIVPETLDWFGLADVALLSNGVLSAGPDDLRSAYRARCNPVLAQARLREL